MVIRKFIWMEKCVNIHTRCLYVSSSIEKIICKPQLTHVILDIWRWLVCTQFQLFMNWKKYFYVSLYKYFVLCISKYVQYVFSIYQRWWVQIFTSRLPLSPFIKNITNRSKKKQQNTYLQTCICILCALDKV